MTKLCSVKVSLHQGSALRPFLFALVINMLIDDIHKLSLWNMMFAENVVLCSESKEEVQTNLEK